MYICQHILQNSVRNVTCYDKARALKRHMVVRLNCCWQSTIHSELTCLFTGQRQQASSYSHKIIVKELQNIILCNIIRGLEL